MFRNYFKTAWRNLMKSKVFSFINIFGLSAGLACCMLISLYLLHETSYDKYHRNADGIYQVGTTFISEHKVKPYAATPAPMAEAMKREFPEVVESTRLFPLFSETKTLLQYFAPGAQPVSFYETYGYLADSTFLQMFTYHFIEGNPASALARPATVVLSEEIARKLFGSHPALGKVIHISSSTNGDHNFTVSGVFRPMNAPSHINGRFFMSMGGGDIENFIKRQAADFATNNIFFTYLQLKPGSDAQKLEAKFPAFIDKYASRDLKAIGFDKQQFLIPLRKIHLEGKVYGQVSPPGSKTYLYILASVALFTLIIACINFMNLATARSSKRSSEVGVRKVLGAEKKSLILQFLGESLLMSLIAFFFALGLTALLLPAFSMMTGRHLTFTFPEQLPLVVGFLGMAIFTGLLAGSYPAFYLSSFQPVKVLKGRFSNSLAAVSLRKGLVVLQFVISVILIISTVVINDQMHYLRSTDLGFDKEQQLIIPLQSETAKKVYPALKSAFLRNQQVKDVGASYYYPGIANIADNLFHRKGQTMHDATVTRMNYVDPSYLRSLGIQPVAGRLYSEEFPSDTNKRIILNESAIHALGYPNAKAAVGDNVYFEFKGESYIFEVVGVVKDFHYEDLHSPITPYGFRLSTDQQFNYTIVHARPGELAGLLKSLESNWHAINPNEPFEYSFLDEDFQKNYMAEERLSAMIRYFTIMAILISCLGLFGLASFSAEQRIKEIGIRKVLGASVSGIVVLLSRDFLKLVGIGALIASPLAWWVMHKWLADFAYRTSISWTVFLFTFIIALGIALFTIGFQAVRSALANPVKNLRTE